MYNTLSLRVALLQFVQLFNPPKYIVRMMYYISKLNEIVGKNEHIFWHMIQDMVIST